MKKVLKFSALALGALGLVTGMNSCSKDDDDSNDCCTFTYTYDGETGTVKACEDGSITYTYGDGTTDTDNWKEDYDSWADMKAEFIKYGGTCD